jgi:hypothetical protein
MGGLHPARARCLLRRTGRVEPHVDARHQVQGEVEVVVRQVGDPDVRPEGLSPAEHLADQLPPAVVVGVGLPREDHL